LIAIQVCIANGIDEIPFVPTFQMILIAIQVWIANSIDGIPLVPTFLKLISRSQVIGWLMILVKISNIGMVTLG
jgi:hypothetical protein